VVGIPPVKHLDSRGLWGVVAKYEFVILEIFKQVRDILLGDVVDIRAAAVFNLFGVTTEPALVIGIGPHQGKEANGL
jgi:hypothetical protein